MKPMLLTLLLACALRGDELYVTNSTVFCGATNYLPAWFCSTNTAPAVLRWEMRTNWIDANLVVGETPLVFNGMEWEPQTAWTTCYETGRVTSNLIATIEWRGKTYTTVLEEQPIGNVQRKYRLETVRKYLEP